MSGTYWREQASRMDDWMARAANDRDLLSDEYEEDESGERAEAGGTSPGQED
jgi:hypothetical protein